MGSKVAMERDADGKPCYRGQANDRSVTYPSFVNTSGETRSREERLAEGLPKTHEPPEESTHHRVSFCSAFGGYYLLSWREGKKDVEKTADAVIAEMFSKKFGLGPLRCW